MLAIHITALALGIGAGVLAIAASKSKWKKKHSWKSGATVLAILLVLASFAAPKWAPGIPDLAKGWFSDSQTASVAQVGNTNLGGICRESASTTLTLNVQAAKNTTGAETFDSEVSFVGPNGIIRGTDSTDGSYTLNCGDDYQLVVESADGASGDNSKILSVLEGSGVVNADGTVSFKPVASTGSLRVGVDQHATLEFKGYDNSNRGQLCNNDDSCTDFEADGTTFVSTTNGTAIALTNDGDFIDVTFDVRAIQTDTEFCDNGCLIGIEAPVSEYDAPTLKFEGLSLREVKANLAGTPAGKQLANYEYVFQYDGEITHDISKLSFYIDASTDLQVDLLAKGRVDSINGKDILVSTALDDSAATTVYTVMDVTLDVS